MSFQTSKAVEEKKKGRYVVRPPRDLTSQFEKRQAGKERSKVEEEEQKKKDDEAARIAEAEAPPPDVYHGLRFHCWVLVLSGKREVAQSFFIEPTTGEDHPLDWDQYLGIETLWNSKNYWVNMQDCSQGVQVLVCSCIRICCWLGSVDGQLTISVQGFIQDFWLGGNLLVHQRSAVHIYHH